MTEMSQPELSVKLRLSAQRALLGQVTPNIRQVYIRYRAGMIELLAVLDGETSDDDRERMEEVTSEIVSDFPDVDLILASCNSISAPEPARQDAQPGDLVFACIYARHEGE